ncbi:hypothetical protein [Streptomyces mayteni]
MPNDTDTVIDFPTDLVDFERTRQTLQLRLEALPPRPWTDAAGIEHGGGRGWVPEHDAAGGGDQEPSETVAVRLGVWRSNMRSRRDALPVEQQTALDEIGL